MVSTHGGSNMNHIVSRFHFRDADIHLEFSTPKKGSGNSGIYIHGNYELQILNKRNKPLGMDDIGSIYGFSKPLVMAGRDPGQWQVYDIRFVAPRRDVEGENTIKGAISAWLNGKMIQDNARFGEARSSFHSLTKLRVSRNTQHGKVELRQTTLRVFDAVMAILYNRRPNLVNLGVGSRRQCHRHLLK